MIVGVGENECGPEDAGRKADIVKINECGVPAPEARGQEQKWRPEGC